MKRVAVLISGEGRNLQALLDAHDRGGLPATFVGVVSNRDDAPGLARAAAAGVPVAVVRHGDFPDREAFDAALTLQLEAWRADWVVLAGFMRVLTPGFTTRWQGRLLNIHPSLLPRHRGLQTHRRVLEAGDREHGATVHFVTADLDGGPAIIQGRFTVSAEDDPQQLALRVLQDVEVHIYPQAVAWCISGDLQLMPEGTVMFRGAPLSAPLTLADLEPGF